MPTRAQVEESAHHHGLGEHAERLADRVRPAWRLNPIGGMRAAPGATKIGGSPDLAEDEAWPRNHRGVAMTFLGQIDTRRIPPWDTWSDDRPWNHGGQLVRVFADLVDCPYQAGLALGLACDPAATLRRVEAPAIPDPFPPGGPWDERFTGERFRALRETPVLLRSLLTAPETDPVLRASFDDRSARANAYAEWAAELRGSYSTHHLLGEPAGIQGDPLETGP